MFLILLCWFGHPKSNANLGYNRQFSFENLKYHKVIIITDADVIDLLKI